MKEYISAEINLAGEFIASLFGGWDAFLVTLFIFIAADSIADLIVAHVFQTNTKLETKPQERMQGRKCLCRKGMILLIVLVSCRLDIILGLDFVRNAVIIAFIINESAGILEKAGLMGIPIPEIITKAIDILKQKSEHGDQ